MQGKRPYQEDCRYPDTDMPENGQRFFVVCDGVGGRDKGEVASRLVANTFGTELVDHDWSANFTSTDFGKALDAAYIALDRNADAHTRDMATTLTFAAFHGGGMTLAHIGDSRIYHIRPGDGILYRSVDHSMVNMMVYNGMLTPDQAGEDPRQNIITRYMSPTEADQTRCMATLLNTSDIQSGDYVFMCTDGVLQHIDDDTLLEIIESKCGDAQKMAQVARQCVTNSDNCTAMLIPIGEVSIQDIHQPAASAGQGRTMIINGNEDGVVNIASVRRGTSSRWISGSWLKKLFDKR